MESEDFFHAFFHFTANTEPPVIYSRWAAISGIAAMLGRNFYLPFGEGNIFPNLYVMLIGEPGTRKSTAIKTIRRRIADAGYVHIAADKSSKEKFLLDLYQGDFYEDSDPEMEAGKRVVKKSALEGTLYDDGPDTTTPREVFIVADEFNDFLGSGNLEFISLLGNLWDYEGVYRARVKNSKSVAIPNPTINILSGNTATGFATAFPPEILGQGFLSRLIIVHGEPSGRKIWPVPVKTEEEKRHVSEFLRKIQRDVRGAATFTAEANAALTEIYRTWKPLEDSRFLSYSTRRFTQLIKLSLICAASRVDTVLAKSDVILANTILSFTEKVMSKALGEFGKSQYADTAHRIMEMLYSADKALTMVDIWKEVYMDFKQQSDLGVVLQNLQRADKIQIIERNKTTAFLPKRIARLGENTEYVDFSLLTQMERDNV